MRLLSVQEAMELPEGTNAVVVSQLFGVTTVYQGVVVCTFLNWQRRVVICVEFAGDECMHFIALYAGMSDDEFTFRRHGEHYTVYLVD